MRRRALPPLRATASASASRGPATRLEGALARIRVRMRLTHRAAPRARAPRARRSASAARARTHQDGRRCSTRARTRPARRASARGRGPPGRGRPRSRRPERNHHGPEEVSAAEPAERARQARMRSLLVAALASSLQSGPSARASPVRPSASASHDERGAKLGSRSAVSSGVTAQSPVSRSTARCGSTARRAARGAAPMQRPRTRTPRAPAPPPRARPGPDPGHERRDGPLGVP